MAIPHQSDSPVSGAAPGPADAASRPRSARLPRWLRPANRLIIGLQRLGMPIGTMHLLTIPGRRSGRLRTTPVSPLTVDGQRYVIAGLDNADWVRNARSAGHGVLTRGRKRQPVRIEELPVDERVPILRAFPTEVPHGVPFFTKVHGVKGDPDSFAALAPACPVFRIRPAGKDGNAA